MPESNHPYNQDPDDATQTEYQQGIGPDDQFSMFKSMHGPAPYMAAVIASGNQEIQYPGVTGRNDHLPCDDRFFCGIPNLEYLNHVPGRTYLHIDVEFLQEKRMACIIGGKGQMEPVSPVAPDDSRVLPITKAPDMDIPVNRLPGEKLEDNSRNQSGTENN